MDRKASRRRQTFLTLFLAGLGLSAFSVILIFLTGGFLTYGALIFLGMLLLGSFHWLVWGRALSQAVAGEREEEKLRRRALGEEPAEEEPLPAHEASQQEYGIKTGPSQRFRRL